MNAELIMHIFEIEAAAILIAIIAYWIMDNGMSKSEHYRLTILRGGSMKNEFGEWVATILKHGTDAEFGIASKAWQACAEIKDAELNKIMHYPECWDTAAYPTVLDAVSEVFKCSECNPSQTSEFHPDWSMLEACREGSKEKDAEIAELKAKVEHFKKQGADRLIGLCKCGIERDELNAKVAMLMGGLDEYWVTTDEGKTALTATEANVTKWVNGVKDAAVTEWCNTQIKN